MIKKFLYTHGNRYIRIFFEFCNEYRIPLFRKEMEYISMYIHDVLPLNYNEQGVRPNDQVAWLHFTSLKIFLGYLFTQDKLLIALEIVKLQDIYEIVYFINLEGIHVILDKMKQINVKYIYQSFLKVKDWVNTRHYSYYSWIIYGWKEIPLEFPSFNSLSDPK